MNFTSKFKIIIGQSVKKEVDSQYLWFKQKIIINDFS